MVQYWFSQCVWIRMGSCKRNHTFNRSLCCFSFFNCLDCSAWDRTCLNIRQCEAAYQYICFYTAGCHIQVVNEGHFTIIASATKKLQQIIPLPSLLALLLLIPRAWNLISTLSGWDASDAKPRVADLTGCGRSEETYVPLRDTSDMYGHVGSEPSHLYPRSPPHQFCSFPLSHLNGATPEAEPDRAHNPATDVGGKEPASTFLCTPLLQGQPQMTSSEGFNCSPPLFHLCHGDCLQKWERPCVCKW